MYDNMSKLLHMFCRAPVARIKACSLSPESVHNYNELHFNCASNVAKASSKTFEGVSVRCKGLGEILACIYFLLVFGIMEWKMWGDEMIYPMLMRRKRVESIWCVICFLVAWKDLLCVHSREADWCSNIELIFRSNCMSPTRHLSVHHPFLVDICALPISISSGCEEVRHLYLIRPSSAKFVRPPTLFSDLFWWAYGFKQPNYVPLRIGSPAAASYIFFFWFWQGFGTLEYL